VDVFAITYVDLHAPDQRQIASADGGFSKSRKFALVFPQKVPDFDRALHCALDYGGARYPSRVFARRSGRFFTSTRIAWNFRASPAPMRGAAFTKLDGMNGPICRLIEVMHMRRVFAVLCLAAAAFAQTAPKAILGSITAFKPEDGLVVIKPDNTDAVNVKLTPDTIFQRVAPGERDLKKATPMKLTDMALGDRVLVSFATGTTEALRILVMSATDIQKRNEADSLDWTKRGISGVVSAKAGNTVTLKKRGLTGEILMTVTVDDKTVCRRYDSDSVKFADAKVSKLTDISVGDQLRARGVKSEDGLKVTAEEIVFGTFVTKAGTITAVNVETKEVTVTELGTNKPLVIKLTADSQIKRMPNMMGMMAGRGGTPGNAPSGTPGDAPAGARGSGTPGTAPGGATAGRMPDIAQMLEHTPAAKLDDLKAGEKIVVSSTKGAKPDEITAIMLLGNADMLIQMATIPSGGGRGAGGGAGGPGMGGMGMGVGLQGLDLPSMIVN
jgi:hypothetical protein